VTRTEVVKRKKPLGKRFAETFLGGDARGVGSYVMLDVLLPAFKDMVADAMTMGVEKMLWGEARSRSRTGARVGGLVGGGVNYNKVSGGGWRPDPRDPRSSRRSARDADEYIIETRVEAEHVLDSMVKLLEKYDQVTVSDLCDLVGETAAYTDNKWGWTDLRGADIRRIREGYLLKLPPADTL
jgi:hypothetical protein